MSAAPLTLGRMAAIVGGSVSGVAADAPVAGLQHDSRLLKPGEIFFAIVSPTGDGHAYLADAAARGACAAVVSRAPEGDPGLPLVRVDDTRAALLRFATWKVAAWGGKIVGITGSTGKTTTKEFTAALLEGGFTVFRTPGNYNNTLGIPLALYHLDGSHEVAVLEMGMSSPGEIAALCQAAPPDVAVVTNVGSVHLEHFADAAALARAKAEIVSVVNPGRWVIAADTTVAVDHHVLGKPESPEDAVRMLGLIQGRSHQVHTGLCLRRDDEVHALCDTAEVFLRPVGEARARWYAHTGEPMDKAGAYAAQGIAALFIERIDGSFATVMGFPVERFSELAGRLGLLSQWLGMP